MTDGPDEPVTINGETFAPTVVPCPSCAAEIDAQRALIEGACPECRTDARALCGDDSADVPEDYEPESYKLKA